LKEVNPSKEHIPVINHGSTSILKLKPSISGWRLYSLICNKKKKQYFFLCFNLRDYREPVINSKLIAREKLSGQLAKSFGLQKRILFFDSFLKRILFYPS
jgi:hypothetical protein